MASRKRKDDYAADPMRHALDVITAMSKSDKVTGFSATTIQQMQDEWRWIDFIDPRTNLPCLLLEWLWGSRGMLAGRLLKIEAEEGVGKSSYLNLQYGMAQRTSNAWCVHAESEGATHPADFIASFGCDPSKIITLRLAKRSIDECFNKLDWATYCIRKQKKNEEDTKIIDPQMAFPIVAGVDSVSGFGTAANMEDDDTDLETGGGGLGLHSRFLSQWFRDRWSLLEQRGVLLATIAQQREKINTGPTFPGGPPKQSGPTTLAARPLNYHASYRLEMKSTPLRIPETPQQIGEVVTLSVTKNKLSPKGKKAVVNLIWNYGFDLTTATIEKLAALSPIMLKSGSVFSVAAESGGWLNVPALFDKKLRYSVESWPQVCYDTLCNLYNRQDLLMEIREALAIRGFGFDFERNYQLSPAEVEDHTQTPDEAAESVATEA